MQGLRNVALERVRGMAESMFVVRKDISWENLNDTKDAQPWAVRESMLRPPLPPRPTKKEGGKEGAIAGLKNAVP